MFEFGVRVLVNTIAVIAAVKLVPNVDFHGHWWELLILGVIFGVINAYIRPIVKLLNNATAARLDNPFENCSVNELRVLDVETVPRGVDEGAHLNAPSSLSGRPAREESRTTHIGV